MKNSRRNFIKKSAAISALSVTGVCSATSGFLDLSGNAEIIPEKRPGKNKHGYIRDAGIKMSFAYFRGIEGEKRKIEFAKQLDVLGAVGGINARMVGLNNVNSWDFEAVLTVKKAWEKAGLKLEVIEGPPALSEKTKLGLEGRDEEITNFITLMKSLSKAGIDTVCYNWMPVISWARTTNRQAGKGRGVGDCL